MPCNALQPQPKLQGSYSVITECAQGITGYYSGLQLRRAYGGIWDKYCMWVQFRRGRDKGRDKGLGQGNSNAAFCILSLATLWGKGSLASLERKVAE